MGSIIGTIIVGAIMGALARLFMKGSQNIGILWTILLGALGAGIGSWIASALSLGTILYWVIGILLAMVFIAIYIGATNKGGAARR